MKVDIPQFFINTAAVSGVLVLWCCFRAKVFRTTINIIVDNNFIDLHAVHADADEDSAKEEEFD